MTIAQLEVAKGRRLAVFLDGTWDREIGNTNVWRLKSLCAPRSDQLIYYSAGVGTTFGGTIRGGLFGYGIDDLLTLSYQWIVEQFQEGDELFIFGFSRGAFAARSLSGLISRCGLLKIGAPLSIDQLYARYRRGNAALTIHELAEPSVDTTRLSNEERWLLRYSRPISVKFTGVWDTVGAVATNEAFHFVTGGDHSFLDVNLRKTEENVFHALAIDENRKVFDVSLLSQYVPGTDPTAPWTSPRTLDCVEQRWFAGAHGNVGGGSYDDLLAQLPLKWLMSRAEKFGLVFRQELDTDEDVVTSTIEDSFGSFLGGIYALERLGRRYWRPIGRPPEARTQTVVHTINETIDRSVFDRWRKVPGYRPTNLTDWAAAHKLDISELTASCLVADPKSVVPD